MMPQKNIRSLIAVLIIHCVSKKQHWRWTLYLWHAVTMM